MIRAPDFWTTDALVSRLLTPAGHLYGLITGARMQRPPRQRASVPVIAVGNYVVGGAVKTPTAIALARLATRMGFSPIVLLRGYGASQRGPMLVDAQHDTAREVGDEALMVATAGVPAVIARDRAAGADFAVACGCDLIILDDGFQSPTLGKDLRIVVLDAGYGVGNGRTLPAGPLRAPLDLQIACTDLLLVVGIAPDADLSLAADKEPGGPGRQLLLSSGSAATVRGICQMVRAAGGIVQSARMVPVGADTCRKRWAHRRIVAFAGIGRPEKLVESLTAMGLAVEELVSFADHHPYSDADARLLLDKAAAGAQLVTTAKDMARLSTATSADLRRLAADADVLEIELQFEQPSVIADQLAPFLPTSGRAERAAAGGDQPS